MLRRILMRRRTAATMLCLAGASLYLVAASSLAPAQTATPQPAGSAKQIIATMLANEDTAAQHKDHYAYISLERSDRTGNHLWNEKVIETNAGKVRLLIQEDGQPLSPDRVAGERGRLAAILADPIAFQKRELALKNDETHAKDMMSLLPKAFLLGDVHEEGPYLRIDFRPNPGYEAQTMEERVLHGMSGSLLIEPKAMRLHRIEGRLPEDVNIGFGLIATIRAGSSFVTTRDPMGQPDWKTTHQDTDINGKAIFFKTIARKQHSEHSNYVRVPNEMTVAEAVEMVER